MKKLLWILIAFAFLNVFKLTRNEVQAQGFTIDTTVYTTSGIPLTNVYSGFRIISSYFLDTNITYEFMFYVDSTSYANGSTSILIKDKSGDIFTYEVKTYTQAEFNTLTFDSVYFDAKAILEEKFGKIK